MTTTHPNSIDEMVRERTSAIFLQLAHQTDAFLQACAADPERHTLLYYPQREERGEFGPIVTQMIVLAPNEAVTPGALLPENTAKERGWPYTFLVWRLNLTGESR